jgi:bifunctional UDP-N-acetylglucosamine pyrophosphorylase/glucosamine-1-phosphate N-acetyltransferase
MFVAPVTVGDGAYTGAGTVVREDVPPGALAVSGGQQRNIEGWVARKRPGSAAAEAAEKAGAANPEPPPAPTEAT